MPGPRRAWKGHGIGLAGFITAPLNGKCPLVGKVQVCPSIHGIQIPLVRGQNVTMRQLPSAVVSHPTAAALQDRITGLDRRSQKKPLGVFSLASGVLARHDTPAKDKVGRGEGRERGFFVRFLNSAQQISPAHPARRREEISQGAAHLPGTRVGWGAGVCNRGVRGLTEMILLNALRTHSGEERRIAPGRELQQRQPLKSIPGGTSHHQTHEFRACCWFLAV